MNFWTRRAAVSLLVLVLVLVLGTAWAYRGLWMRYDDALNQLQARSERLDGVLQAGPKIADGLQAARAAVSPWLHPAADSAANDMQQRLRELIAAGGNTLVSSQAALQPASDAALAQAQISATITGPWTGLVRLAQDLQKQMPPYWVQSAVLTRDGANTPGAAQTARLVLHLQAPLAPSPEAK